MPNEQLKKKWLRGAKEKLPNLSEELLIYNRSKKVGLCIRTKLE